MGYWVTVQVHEGYMPAELECKIDPKCKGRMTSSGFRDPALWPSIVPRVADADWYRPTKWEMKQKGMKTPKLVAYIRGGGLVARAASEHTPMFPQDEQ
jgi:hypothetical protein